MIGPSRPGAPPRPSDGDSDGDDYLPDLPPDLIKIKHTKRPLGPPRPQEDDYLPDLPPDLIKTKRPQETDEDDTFSGPMPLPTESSSSDAASEFRLRERETKERKDAELAKSKKPVRDEWMLVPPKEIGLMRSIDPTKMKSRGFHQTSKPHSGTVGPSSSSSGINLWTETPQERQQRLEDEVLGKRKRVELDEADEEDDESRRKRLRDVAMKQKVDDYNKQSRPDTLLSSHAKKKKKAKDEPKEDKDPPPIWDHARDMGLGGRLMDDSKRNDIVRGAKDLGSKFGKGTYL